MTTETLEQTKTTEHEVVIDYDAHKWPHDRRWSALCLDGCETLAYVETREEARSIAEGHTTSAVTSEPRRTEQELHAAVDRLEASLTEHKRQYDDLLRTLERHGLISVAKGAKA